MGITALLKNMRGYLRIRVWGEAPERFLNLCSVRGILLWDIRQQENGFTMCISIRGFLQLRPIVRKTRTRAVILKREGLPFLLPRIRKRRCFVLCMVFCVFFWILSSLFIWDIGINGNYQITEDMLRTWLKSQNIREGILQKEIDIEAMEEGLRSHFPEIIWVSARLEGTKLLIDLKENDASSPEAGASLPGNKKTAATRNTYSNLNASVEGTLLSMIVRKGIPQAVIGDTVEVGTLLVEGKIPVFTEEGTIRYYQYTESDADFVIEYSIPYEEQLQAKYIKKEYTGREKKIFYLKTGAREWKWLGQITFREYQKTEYLYTDKQAKELFKRKINEFLTDLEQKGVQIIEKDVKIQKDTAGYTAKGTFRVKGNAVERVFLKDTGDQSAEEFSTHMDIPSQHMQKIFGMQDTYVKKLERDFDVTIVDRNGSVVIAGEEKAVKKVRNILTQLLEISRRGNEIEEQNVDYAIEMGKEEQEEVLTQIDGDIICHTVNGKPIKPKTLGQKQYVDAIRKKMIVFGLGPAGTGKTYLAMAMAITAFKNDEVSRIILTRPAIEAGEKLGFLPGDLQSKVDPYLRPLYDALYQIMGAETFAKNMEKGLIEVAPLAYMRGRTLDNAFIILDEAQNTTPAQMKMFLTRIGFGSKVIVTGDSSQKDLPAGTRSGLDVAEKVLSKIDDIAFCTLTSKDVVRHPLVQKIVKAYDDYEAKEKSRSERAKKAAVRGGKRDDIISGKRNR